MIRSNTDRLEVIRFETVVVAAVLDVASDAVVVDNLGKSGNGNS